MSNIDNYVKALSDIDQTLEIVTDAVACRTYVGKNYSRIPAETPLAIIYPLTSGQIQTVVKLANEYKVALVVRSSDGEETCHGSSVPAQGVSAVAVNLSKMKKIMRVDTRNNMALIEPGVTYSELDEALQKQGYTMEHPLMPRSGKSVIASLLDRDPVMSPKYCWDVPDPLTCVELVMGNGSLFRTGSAAGPGTLEEMLASGCAINQPQGPYCLDLARVICGSQGTLAIVTWASVKIRPVGSVRTVTYVQSDDCQKLAAYASQVIRRRLGENVFLVNRTGFAKLTGAETAPVWTMVCDVCGYRYFPERYMENQRADMEDLAKEYGLTLVASLEGVCNEKVTAVIDDMGASKENWRGDFANRMDLFFLSTMDKLGMYTALAKAAVEKCGLDSETLVVYCQPEMMGRSCHIEYLIPADADKAAELEQLLGMALLDNKAFFSRPYGAMTEAVYEKSLTQTSFLPHVKNFFDENHIMNPQKLVYDGGRR